MTLQAVDLFSIITFQLQNRKGDFVIKKEVFGKRAEYDSALARSFLTVSKSPFHNELRIRITSNQSRVINFARLMGGL